MSEEPGLDVLGPQRLAQERIRLQVDLPDREVVRGPEPRVYRLQLGTFQHVLTSHAPAFG